MCKRIASLLMLLSLIGCDVPSEKIDVYAIDQRYACGDDTIYTAIRVENPADNGPKLQDRTALLDINSKDIDIGQEIEAAVFASTEEALAKNQTQKVNNNSVVGKNFRLIFPDKLQQISFINQSPSISQCYIYRFTGYFKNKILDHCGEGNRFVVSEFSLIPMYPDCVKQFEDDLNKALEEENNRNKGHED